MDQEQKYEAILDWGMETKLTLVCGASWKMWHKC